MQKLLLIALQLADLLLLAVVIRLILLHQLLVGLEQGRILNQIGQLDGLLVLVGPHWIATVCSRSVRFGR